MRQLFNNKLLLGVLCIAIGVAPLLSLINTVESGKAAFARNFNKEGHKLMSVRFDGAQVTYNDLKRLGTDMPGIKGMIPIVKGSAQVSSYKSQSMVELKAVSSDYGKYAALEIIKGKFISKSLLENKQRVIVLDDLTADAIFGTTDVVGRNVMVSYNGAEIDAVVIGVCKKMDLSEAGLEESRGIAYIPINVLDNNVDFYTVDEALILVDINIEEAKARISHYLASAGITGEFEIAFVNQFGIMNSFLEENEKMFIAAAILWFFAVLVGLINILLVDVTQDKKYYGLLKFYGNTEKQIRRIVYIKALTMSMASSVCCIAAGIIASFAVSLYLNMPLHLSVHTFTLGILLPGAISLIAAVYPAVRAAKTDMNKVIWQYD